MGHKNDEWHPVGHVTFGGSEGIYLTVHAYGYEETPTTKKYCLGTFKTLETDREAFYMMHKLAADFSYEAIEFMNNNSEDFNWSGYDVKFIKDGKTVCHIHTNDKEGAYELCKRKCKNVECDYVLIINNETCAEKKITKAKIEV